ncbi:MAG: alpha/beta hydrolase [Sulfolobales archaeon]
MVQIIRGELLGFKHIYIPPSKGDRILVLLHGTGGDEEDLVPLARALDLDAGILSPRGKVLENGMPRFFRRIAPGVYDLEDLRYRAEELADFIEIASHQYNFKRARAIAIGYSNGANIAIATMLLRPGAFAGAILLRPFFPVDLGVRPNLAGKEVLILAGSRDPIAPLNDTENLYRMLISLGASVELRIVEAGHELGKRDIEAMREWLPKAYSNIERNPSNPDPGSLADLY